MHATDLAVPPAILAGLAALRAVWPEAPARFVPLAAIGLGIAVAVGTAGGPTLAAFVEGTTQGLAACGLWSAAVKPGVQAVRRGRAARATKDPRP